MNKITGIVAIATLAAAPMAYAGGLDEPVVEAPVMAPQMVVEDSGSGSDDWVVGLMLLAIVAGIATSN